MPRLDRRHLAVLGVLALVTACRPEAPETAATRAAAAPPAAPVLRLGIIGDQTLADDLAAARRVLARGVEELTRHHHRVAPLDAVIHTGDLVESSAAVSEIAAAFAAAAEILDRLPVPWYPAAGDHDVNPPGYLPGSADRSRRDLFRRLLGDRVPAAGDALHYAVDLGAHRLIVLDSQEVAHADPRWGNVFLARIGDRQLGWLASELAAGGPQGARVVVLHQPHWLAWSGWRRVHELLRDHGVALVVSGHLHHPQDDGTLDGIRYLTVGATGGVTRDGSRRAGDVQHVTVVEIDGRGGDPGSRVGATLLALDGDRLDWPSRRDMERAQALEVMLGSLHEIGERTSIFVDSGRLVAECGSGAPAGVALVGLGNPIDVEVTLTIAPPPEVELLDPGFRPGACAGASPSATSGPATCRLAVPDPEVLFANPSGVEMAPGAPLWRTGLGLAPTAGSAVTGDGLAFRVRLAWSAEAASDSAAAAEELWLERPLRLAVERCRSEDRASHALPVREPRGGPGRPPRQRRPPPPANPVNREARSS